MQLHQKKPKILLTLAHLVSVAFLTILTTPRSPDGKSQIVAFCSLECLLLYSSTRTVLNQHRKTLHSSLMYTPLVQVLYFAAANHPENHGYKGSTPSLLADRD